MVAASFAFVDANEDSSMPQKSNLQKQGKYRYRLFLCPP